MKNIILIFMLAFSIVWSQDASARVKTAHKKKPTVSQKKSSAKKKHSAVKKPASGGYKSAFLKKRHSRSVASDLSHKAKSKKKTSKSVSKKKRRH